MSRSIFLSGGLGDFFALESHYPPGLKPLLRSVYYATRASKDIAELYQLVPTEYPELKHHTPLWSSFFNYLAFHSKTELEGELTPLPPDWNTTADWSIEIKFPHIENRNLIYQGSSFLKHQLTTDLPQLPKSFAVIHPDTTDWRPRRIQPEEWTNLIDILHQWNLTGVILNTGKYQSPEHPELLDLSNKTTLPESIEILKRAKGFIGIDSCLSVLASQLFPAERLLIKSKFSHLLTNKQIYYAPHTSFDFIVPALTPINKI